MIPQLLFVVILAGMQVACFEAGCGIVKSSAGFLTQPDGTFV